MNTVCHYSSFNKQWHTVMRKNADQKLYSTPAKAP